MSSIKDFWFQICRVDFIQDTAGGRRFSLIYFSEFKKRQDDLSLIPLGAGRSCLIFNADPKMPNLTSPTFFQGVRFSIFRMVLEIIETKSDYDRSGWKDTFSFDEFLVFYFVLNNSEQPT